jgi:ferrochelatase
MPNLCVCQADGKIPTDDTLLLSSPIRKGYKPAVGLKQMEGRQETDSARNTTLFKRTAIGSFMGRKEDAMKRGILLINTGAPDAPTESALSAYLEEFLENSRTTTVPKLLRAPLVHWIVVPQHRNEMVAAYASIWTAKGSPMIHCCTTLARKLKSRLGIAVSVGMAHGKPSLKAAVIDLLYQGVDEIGVLWMFPQHDISKQGCVTAIRKELKRLHSSARLRIAPPFYNEPAFTEPLSAQLRGTNDYILFNYHGLSEHSLKLADPTQHHCLAAPTCCHDASLAHDTCYRFQCFATSRNIALAADVPEVRYSSAFQSRHRHGRWLEPHTEDVLKALPAMGKKQVTVLSPAFLCDDLETLEEIGQRCRYLFLEAGGKSFRVIPCLNDTPASVKCLETVIAGIENWPIERIPMKEAETVCP